MWANMLRTTRRHKCIKHVYSTRCPFAYLTYTQTEPNNQWSPRNVCTEVPIPSPTNGIHGRFKCMCFCTDSKSFNGCSNKQNIFVFESGFFTAWATSFAFRFLEHDTSRIQHASGTAHQRFKVRSVIITTLGKLIRVDYRPAG